VFDGPVAVCPKKKLCKFDVFINIAEYLSKFDFLIMRFNNYFGLNLLNLLNLPFL
jgi:hypothetical protein